MPRSLWKGPFIDSFLIKKSGKLPTISSPKVEIRTPAQNSGAQMTLRIPRGSKKLIKVWSRRSVIIPEFIDQSFEIHNGKSFISLIVNEDMIGHKFGEFASTRKKTIHKKKLKK
jgi:small subunit ribosomal protein S19